MSYKKYNKHTQIREKSWRYYLDIAIKSKTNSENFLSASVKNLMKEKGFPDRVTSYLEANFASSDEVLIIFNKRRRNGRS